MDLILWQPGEKFAVHFLIGDPDAGRDYFLIYPVCDPSHRVFGRHFAMLCIILAHSAEHPTCNFRFVLLLQILVCPVGLHPPLIGE